MSSYYFQKEIVEETALRLTGTEVREGKVIPTAYGWKFFDHEIAPRTLIHLEEKSDEELSLRIERFPYEAPTEFIEASLVPGSEEVSARSLATLFLALHGVEK